MTDISPCLRHTGILLDSQEIQGMKKESHSGVTEINRYDAWFRAQVQKALDDRRPAISDDDARAYFRKLKQQLSCKR